MNLVTTIKLYCGGPGSGRHKELWEMTRKEAGVGEPSKLPDVPKYKNLERIARDTPEKLTSKDKEVLDQVKQARREFSKAVSQHKQYVSRSNEHLDSVKQAISDGKISSHPDYPFLSNVQAEVGYPGSGSSVGNLIEPHPKNNVPSLKNRIKVPLDEEIQRQEEDIMPDKAKERKAAQHRRFGKLGGLQVW